MDAGAVKLDTAIYADDPAWAKVRPPLVELTPEQAKTLAAELKAISFTMPGMSVVEATGQRGPRIDAEKGKRDQK
jgi:hypothetical protein